MNDVIFFLKMKNRSSRSTTGINPVVDWNYNFVWMKSKSLYVRGSDCCQFEELGSELISYKTTRIWVDVFRVDVILRCF